MNELAQPLDVNTLHNICVVDKHSSLLHRMWKSQPTCTGPEVLRRTFLSNTLKTAVKVLNRLHASAQSQSFLLYMLIALITVVCWFIRRQGSSPRPDIKTKYKKSICSAISSQQISGKNSESK